MATGISKDLLSNTYYYQDASGSTTHLANSSGTLSATYRYDLQGTPLDGNGNVVTTDGYFFTGQKWMSGLGLYDLRNRFYSPDLGRFLQTDPIGFGGDPGNLYRYCGGDSVNRGDPLGLRADEDNNDGEPPPPIVPDFDPDRNAINYGGGHGSVGGQGLSILGGWTGLGGFPTYDGPSGGSSSGGGGHGGPDSTNQGGGGSNGARVTLTPTYVPGYGVFYDGNRVIVASGAALYSVIGDLQSAFPLLQIVSDGNGHFYSANGTWVAPTYQGASHSAYSGPISAFTREFAKHDMERFGNGVVSYSLSCFHCSCRTCRRLLFSNHRKQLSSEPSLGQ